MDITEMLGLLATDLKMTLDTEISTVEGTRAINKAVDELSRSIPRERIYDHTWIKAVTDDSFTTPATESGTSIVNAMDISSSVDGATATIATTWNDVPRPVKLTLTDTNSSVTRMTVIIKGTDADGVYREERFYRHGGKIQTGKVYFSSIYEVEINEINGNGASDTLSIGTDEPDMAIGGIWVGLDNPVEPGTMSLYSASGKSGTRYTLDTDYEMDYANGRIRMINGGNLSDATVYYANYNRASVAIDISSIIPELIRISRVLYPADKVPQQAVGFSIWKDMLTIGSLRQGVSQEVLTDGKHIAIYYEARHAPPTEVGSGSYPDLLDEVVILGATGHALLMEALEYELQAVTDLASMRTELGLTTAIHTAVVTALDKVTTYVTDMDTALDATISELSLASQALVKVPLYLETNDTTDNAKDVLANITDDLAELRTKITVAQDAIATALGLVATSQLDKATTGGEDVLETVITPTDLINKLNDGGPDVPSKYGEYARTQVQIAQARIQQSASYGQEAQARLANLRTYIEESIAWMRMGEIFIAEAGGSTATANTYIAEANGRFNMTQAFIQEANSRITELNQHLAEAAQYQEAAGVDLILADRYRAEAQSRLTEFRNILSSKSEYRKKVVSVPVIQPA